MSSGEVQRTVPVVSLLLLRLTIVSVVLDC